jgi:hypothetical protein
MGGKQVWEISSGKLLKRDGWICINTDGAAKGNMIVGCGCVAFQSV